MEKERINPARDETWSDVGVFDVRCKLKFKRRNSFLSTQMTRVYAMLSTSVVMKVWRVSWKFYSLHDFLFQRSTFARWLLSTAIYNISDSLVNLFLWWIVIDCKTSLRATLLHFNSKYTRETSTWSREHKEKSRACLRTHEKSFRNHHQFREVSYGIADGLDLRGILTAGYWQPSHLTSTQLTVDVWK